MKLLAEQLGYRLLKEKHGLQSMKLTKSLLMNYRRSMMTRLQKLKQKKSRKKRMLMKSLQYSKRGLKSIHSTKMELHQSLLKVDTSSKAKALQYHGKTVMEWTHMSQHTTQMEALHITMTSTIVAMNGQMPSYMTLQQRRSRKQT